jgi:putative membrane protein
MPDPEQNGRETSTGIKTDLAEDRTVLANERTFASWLRTGFAAIGIGLAFNALFTRVEPPWVPKLIATAFLGIGIFIFIAAERRLCAVMKRLHTHQVSSLGGNRARLMSYAAAAATLALVAVMWLLPIQPPKI